MGLERTCRSNFLECITEPRTGGIFVVSTVIVTHSHTHYLSGDSTHRRITLTRAIKRPTCGTLKKDLVGATDLQSRLINIINIFIVL